MIILDEHIPQEQRELLKSWNIAVHHIGYDVERKGIQDETIIPVLHRLRYPTFFTLDFGFYRRELCHTRYCLVCMDIHEDEVASFVRRFIRHPEFNTHAKRMGTVVRLSRGGLWAWQLRTDKQIELSWQKR